MAYTIIKSDGATLTTIANGTINTTSTSIALPGRNYAGYGEYLDTNFVHILENFANSGVPANPIRGQLWYNTTSSTMYICPTDGETNPANWYAITTASSSGNASLGNLTVTGNILTGNLTATNKIDANAISCNYLTVNVNAIMASANVTGTANISTLRTTAITSGSQSTTGVLTGVWTANGAGTPSGGPAGTAFYVIGGNLVVANTSGRGIKADNFYYSNGTAISFGGTYSNTNVAAYLPTYSGTVGAFNATLQGSAVTTGAVGNSGTITGNWSLTTGSNLRANTVYDAAQPNITSVGTLISLAASGNIDTTGNINVTSGNITTATGVFIGNGAGLTNLNIVAGTSIVNGTSNVVVDASSNVRISVAGQANVIQVSSTQMTLSGNANAGNVGAATGVFTTAVLANGANGKVVANNFTITGAAYGNSNVTTVTGNLGLRAVSAIYTDNVAAASSTIANAAIHAIGQPTFAALNAGVTAANAATFYIVGAPTAGTNMTITNRYSLFVEQGSSYFGGNVTAANLNTGGRVVATGNVTGGNITTGGKVDATGNISTSANIIINGSGNINTSGNINVTSGNITTTTGVFSGNGAGLTNLNVAGGTQIVNGTSNVNIPTTNGNVTISANNSPNIVVITGNPSGTNTFVINGNANSTNFGTGTLIVGTAANTPLIQNGTSNIKIASGGAVTVSVGGISNMLTIGATETILANSSTTGRVALGTTSGGYINLGNLTTSSSPLIDFNTSTTLVDYNVRLQASGSSAGLAAGNLDIISGNTNFGNTTFGTKLFANGSITGNLLASNAVGGEGGELVLAYINTAVTSGGATPNVWHLDVTTGNVFRIFRDTSGTPLTAMAIEPVDGNVTLSGNLALTGNVIGNLNSSGNILALGDIIAYSSSDQRLKENITPIENALDKIKKISGVMFDWKEGHELDRKHDTGLIAQEVEEVLPEVVVTRPSGYKAVRYEKIMGLVVQAIKELSDQVDELKKR